MKKIFLTLVCIVIFAMPCFSQDYSKVTLDAVIDSVKTNPEYVKEWANNAIQKNQKNSDAYVIKALVAFSEEDYQATLTTLNKAVKLATKKSYYSKSDILCLRGLVYQKVEEYDKAIVDIDAAIKADKKNYKIYEFKASLFQKIEQYDKAEQTYKTLLNLKDSVAYRLGLVDCLIHQDKTDEALTIVDKIIKYQPRLAEPYRLRTTIKSIINENQGAIDDYIKYMELDNVNYSLDYLVFLSITEYRYTIDALSKMISSSAGNSLWLSARIRVHSYHRDFAKALADITILESTMGESAFSISQKSFCYGEQGEYSKQIKLLDRLIDTLNVASPDLLVERASAYRNAGLLSQAMNDYNGAIELMPNNSDLYINRGFTQVMLKNSADAIKDYNIAVSLGSENPFLYEQIGKYYLANGDTIKANEAFETVINLDSASFSAAIALSLIGREKEGLDLANRLVSLDSNKGSAYYNQACLYALINKKEEAINTLKRAFENGYVAWSYMTNDPDLENIRQEENYLNLINSKKREKVLSIFQKISEK